MHLNLNFKFKCKRAVKELLIAWAAKQKKQNIWYDAEHYSLYDMSFSRSRSFLPLSLSLFVCLCVCRWRWLRCFYDSFINVKRQKSMQCIHIVPLYTITTTMFGCCLLLGCEKYRQTTRFVVVFPLFPYASWPPAQRQQNIREKEAPPTTFPHSVCHRHRH